MNDAIGHYIAPKDLEAYRTVIRRERVLRQSDREPIATAPGVSCVMVVKPPAGFEVGKCLVCRIEPAFPYCFELSILGYPGFGILDTIRARIGDDYFSFSRNATPNEIRLSFPSYWWDKIRVTGGRVEIADGEYVSTGRLFIGFSEQPVEFHVAKTDEPLEGAFGYDEVGVPLPAPKDEGGFNTTDDPRVTARKREVRFLLSPVLRDCVTLVDTSLPSPIAAGALAFAAPVASMGLSLISIEPRVYQELTGVFDSVIADDVVDDATETPPGESE